MNKRNHTTDKYTSVELLYLEIREYLVEQLIVEDEIEIETVQIRRLWIEEVRAHEENSIEKQLI